MNTGNELEECYTERKEHLWAASTPCNYCDAHVVQGSFAQQRESRLGVIIGEVTGDSLFETSFNE